MTAIFKRVKSISIINFMLALVLAFSMVLLPAAPPAFADQTIARYERIAQPTVSYAAAKDELAVVNFKTVWGNKKKNIESMDKYIEQADDKGVKLLLFPEMCVTGYASSSDPNSEIYKWAVDSAETKEGPTATHFANLADEYDMWIVYGATEVVPDGAPIPVSFNGGKDDGQPHAYNSAFACSPTGEVTTYQKITPVEGSWCLPGVTPVLLDARSKANLKLGLIGLSICYDTYATPEIGRYYAAKGANFLLNPTATSRSYSDVTKADGTLGKDGVRDPQGWEWYYRNRLESNADREGFKVLSANIVGGDGPGQSTYNFPGGSVIVGSNATYYGGIEDSAMLGRQYANLYPNTTPKIITAKEGMITNGVSVTASTGSTVRDLDFAPELYAQWYKDLADKQKAGDDLKYTFSYDKSKTDDSTGYENYPTAAVANMIGVWGDKDATITEMDEWVQEAADKGVEMLLFPETVLTGYGWVDPARDSFEGDNRAMQVITAETIPGPTTNHFKELAEKHNMIIVVGMCEKVDERLFERVESGTYAGQTVEKIYNSAAIIFPDKETISYRKTQRAGSSSSTGEGQWSVTGDGPVMFDTKWGKVGIDICRDGHFYPEEGRVMAASGCNIFFHITATTGGPWYRETRIGSYTDRDGMAALTANLLGLDGEKQVRDIVVDASGDPILSGSGNLQYTAWRPATAADVLPITDAYDFAAYTKYQADHPTSTNDVNKARLFQFSYGPFNSTSLIITPYHNAKGAKTFDPLTGYGIDLNGTGPESAGFDARKTSPHGIEVATMDLSGTGFNITNFNPDLFSHMYDELAVLYREGYKSIYEDLDATVTSGEGGSATGTGKFNPGDTVNIAATPQAGYEFAGWTTNSYGVAFADASAATTTFVMPSNAAIVQATFKPIAKQESANQAKVLATGIKAAQSTVYVKAGKSVKLPYIVDAEQAGSVDVTWSASKASVASVKSTAKKSGKLSVKANKNAKLTIKAGKKAGRSKIVLKAGAQKLTIIVKVVKKAKGVAKKSVKISGIPLGKTLSLGATANLKAAFTKSATALASWKSSDTSVVKVDAAGRITALKAGSATITLTVGGKTSKFTLTVK